MNTSKAFNDALDGGAARSLSHDSEALAPAWELIDVGRYRPRRIRGSFRGRELG